MSKLRPQNSRRWSHQTWSSISFLQSRYCCRCLNVQIHTSTTDKDVNSDDQSCIAWQSFIELSWIRCEMIRSILFFVENGENLRYRWCAWALWRYLSSEHHLKVIYGTVQRQKEHFECQPTYSSNWAQRLSLSVYLEWIWNSYKIYVNSLDQELTTRMRRVRNWDNGWRSSAMWRWITL